MEKKLAKVSKATLDIQERGILNFWVYVDYEEGLSQGVGGICLDDYDPVLKTRVGTAYGCEMIRQLLLIFGVNDFSEMKDKMVWVLGEGDGFSFTPKGFESLKVNGKQRRLLFSEVFEKFASRG